MSPNRSLKRKAPVRVVMVSGRPTPRLLQAFAAFGLGLRRGTPRPARAALARPPSGAACVLVLGPSGSGKSTLLEHWRRRTRAVVCRPRRTRAGLLDLVRRGTPEAVALLAAAGLADATLLGRRAHQLSEGQRARLWLALAMARLRPGGTLIVDELASNLDRATARTLCLMLRRWAARAGVRLIAATAHDDVRAWLAPDAIVTLDQRGHATVGAERTRS